MRGRVANPHIDRFACVMCLGRGRIQGNFHATRSVPNYNGVSDNGRSVGASQRALMALLLRLFGCARLHLMWTSD